jgi:hypothetical protein
VIVSLVVFTVEIVLVVPPTVALLDQSMLKVERVLEPSNV